jgi:hypothetical protein
MRRYLIKVIITRLLPLDILMGLAAYWLQPLDPRITWFLICSVTVFLLLGVATVFLLLEWLAEREDGRW